MNELLTPEQIQKVQRSKDVRERASWLLDAIATATQDRMFLRDDPEENEIVTEAILSNGSKAIAVALLRDREAICERLEGILDELYLRSELSALLSELRGTK